MRRLLLAAIVAATLAGCAVVPPPYTVHVGPRHYCFGEGGQVDECVSPGSAGR